MGFQSGPRVQVGFVVIVPVEGRATQFDGGDGVQHGIIERGKGSDLFDGIDELGDFLCGVTRKLLQFFQSSGLQGVEKRIGSHEVLRWRRIGGR